MLYKVDTGRTRTAGLYANFTSEDTAKTVTDACGHIAITKKKQHPTWRNQSLSLPWNGNVRRQHQGNLMQMTTLGVHTSRTKHHGRAVPVILHGPANLGLLLRNMVHLPFLPGQNLRHRNVVAGNFRTITQAPVLLQIGTRNTMYATKSGAPRRKGRLQTIGATMAKSRRNGDYILYKFLASAL